MGEFWEIRLVERTKYCWNLVWARLRTLDKKHLLVTLDDGSLVCSINIKTKVDKDQVSEDIVEQLRELADILKNLNISE